MQVDLKRNLSPEQLAEIRRDLAVFDAVIEDGLEVRIMASAEKTKLEAFMEKHKSEIERGLIAAPGSTVQLPGGQKYDVAADGSWRRRG